MVDSKLYVRAQNDNQLIIIMYVDDIIFGGFKNKICKEFFDQMQIEFEISMMGEFSYFLGLQINQLDKGIFISQIKYMKEMLKKFNMEEK